MNLDRLPPHNLDAERSLLGGILRYPDAMLTLQGNLRAEHFFADANQSVYRAMLELLAARKPIELVLLHEQLRHAGQLENIGGVGYIAELYESEPTGAQFEYHAAIVREKAMVRGLIHAAHEILRDAFDEVQPAEAMVAQAALIRAHSSFQRRLNTKPRSTSMPSALPSFQNRLFPFIRRLITRRIALSIAPLPTGNFRRRNVA